MCLFMLLWYLLAAFDISNKYFKGQNESATSQQFVCIFKVIFFCCKFI